MRAAYCGPTLSARMARSEPRGVRFPHASRDAQVARLRALRAKVLEVTNLPRVDVLGSALLDGHMRARLVETLGNAGGSWCCRPHKDDTAMPNNYAWRALPPRPAHP